MGRKATLLMSEFVTHDVKRFVLTKPQGFRITPGNATVLTIDEPRFRDEMSPFTPTSLNSDGVLEFTIKRYPRRQAITDRLHALRPGARLIVGHTFGDIRYKGPGVFIAAGAGVTPFIAILRDLRRKGTLGGNRLIFSNKTWEDIVYERELRDMLGERAIFTLTREERVGYEAQRVTQSFLKSRIGDFRKHFYICGPAKFVLGVRDALLALGVREERLVYDEP